MSEKNDIGNVKQQEELTETTPPDSVGEETKKKQRSDDEETLAAMKKFTDEDDMGEISFKSIIGGDFLMSKFVMKQVLFVMFCVILMIIYTGNRYDSQQDIILIDSLRHHLQDVKYNVLTQSSELMNMTRQSNIERRLSETKDSMLHNPVTPPFLIMVNSDREQDREEQTREVLVDSIGVGDIDQEAREEAEAEEAARAAEKNKKKGEIKQNKEAAEQSVDAVKQDGAENKAATADKVKTE